MRLKLEASLSFAEESALKDRMAEINKHTLSNEQYSRKSSVRLFGKPEEEGEGIERKAVKFFNISHQTGKVHNVIPVKQSGRDRRRRHRPIILKFISHKSKVLVITKRKIFKKQNLVLLKI